jgi:hypothetical protein
MKKPKTFLMEGTFVVRCLVEAGDKEEAKVWSEEVFKELITLNTEGKSGITPQDITVKKIRKPKRIKEVKVEQNNVG